MTHWEVTAAGVLTTVQDLGREGWRHLGVARAGALDPHTAALANQLLGNDAGAAVLEMTLHGPALRLPQPARIAITGADVMATSNGASLPGYRPVTVPAGELKLAGIRGGIRAWLAVAGGFDVPLLMGSRSTDLRGGFGGMEGRAVRAGDRLAVDDSGATLEVETPRITSWWIGGDDDYDSSQPVRFVASSHPLAAGLAERAWHVSPNSNRQGIRLQGSPLSGVSHHGVSEPVAIGTLQLPPDGQPIVLMADAQTVGGYARLGHVIAADLPRLAQAGPGAMLTFKPVGNGEARELAREQSHRRARAAIAIEQRLSRSA